MMDSTILFETNHLGKQYPGTIALQDVSMKIESGKIVGLVGENGAGKSTLLKLIMGAEAPTSGSMTAHGVGYAPKNTREANSLGVGMVFQEQSLILNLTVGQNIYLGNEESFKKHGLIQWKAMYTKVQTYLEQLGIEGISAEKKVADYMFSDRQMIEVARVLNTVKESGIDQTLILLDEPTSVLSDHEIKQLFGYMRKLKEAGNSVIFVSHRLDEIMEICDLVYVFKDGRQVGCLERADASEDTLYQMMVGGSNSGEYYRTEEQLTPSDDIVLEFQHVGLKGACKDVSFALHRGEVLGICGVTGSGKEDVCAVVCGDASHTSGDYLLHRQSVHFSQPCQALEAGILAVPKERREEAVCGTLSILDNMFMSNYSAGMRHGVINARLQGCVAHSYIKKLNIKCTGEKEMLEQLSGGNAQKVVFARALISGAEVLVLNHPTRGVDVGAKAEIYAIIRELIRGGASIILLGDTLEECIGLSNRLLIMKDGVVTRELDASVGRKPTQLDIIQFMM